MKKIIDIIYLISLFILFFVLNTEANENPCFKCHLKQDFEKEYIHEPLKKGLCIDCHNPHVARYKSLLQKKEKDFCFSCHKDKLEKFSQGIVHQPVLEGKCLICHTPHASKLKGLISIETIAESCFSCHKSLSKQYQYGHKPFSEGLCIKCHNPHQSNNVQLLSSEPDIICVTCHAKKEIKLKHKNYEGDFKWCLSCHHPHGSDRKFLIRKILHVPYSMGCKECHASDKQGSQNCLRCHTQIQKKMSSLHSHLSVMKGNSCVACHSPHAGDDKFLLLYIRQENICKKCHLYTFDNATKRIYKHIDSGICTNCHEVHGSNEPAMLKGDGIDVCVKCHKTQGQFSHPVGQKVRDMRNDQKMTCVTCHYPHGTDYKYELKLSGAKDLCVQCHRSY